MTKIIDKLKKLNKLELFFLFNVIMWFVAVSFVIFNLILSGQFVISFIFIIIFLLGALAGIEFIKIVNMD